MPTAILKYSLDCLTGNALFINDVSNGLSCNCICAKCGKRMVAIQGLEKEWHFRHHEESDCSGGQETAIHKLAKQIILDNTKIFIPGETLLYGEARQEDPFLTIIPDVTVVSDNQTIYFEIAVTHHIEGLKEEFYKRGKYKSVEVDLSNVNYDIKPKELEDLVLNEINNKRKIYWMSVEKSEGKSNANIFWLILLAIGSFFLFRRRKK
jgi:hypothetical protein